MDALTQRAIGPAVRLLCQVRLVVLAFALVLALLDGAGWLGVFLVVLAAPFSFVPALNWDTRGRFYARNGILLAGDTAVAVVALLPLAGSPLMAVYAAATAALWGLFAGLRLAVVMAAPLCLYQLTAYDGGWRGLVTGAAGAVLTIIMTWTGTHLGRRLRRQAVQAAELAAVRADQAALAERLSLARDLHDTVAGDLAGLALAARGLADRLDREGAAADTVGVARELGAAVRTAHEHTRRALGELRDDPDGLAALLTETVGRWTERTGTPAAADVDPGVDAAAGPGRARHVRAVVTELLENVRKHAGASHVAVTVAVTDGAVRVVVSDDGAGLGAAGPPGGGSALDTGGSHGGHYGMRGVRERAQLCGGDATWEAGPEGGTVVTVVLPAEPARALVEAA
ncbi:sensor histidine kinase [Promicromonospora sukumoe]|uniref:sensor histidine kinase n=1 Tax=Promicromonospora sukumoe TaxID=88382 RepID=UPI000372A8FC|nr:ATP-binding protein [Promicromonospora sukumoe]